MSTSTPDKALQPFALWTKPIEQSILLHDTPAQIAALLGRIDNGDFAPLQTATASYDILNALGDEKKAAELLRLGAERFGNQTMKNQVDETVIILSQNRQPPESQQPFFDFAHSVLFPGQSPQNNE